MSASSLYLMASRKNNFQKMKLNTQKSYLRWIEKFDQYCITNKVNPLEGKELIRFLKFLSADEKIAKSSLRQAKHALLFLYKNVLELSLDNLKFEPHTIEKRTPLVLAPNEISSILSKMKGDNRLMASLLYGSGIRSTECVKLRVRDFKLNKFKIVVTDEITGKKRDTILPKKLVPEIQKQILKVNLRYNENSMLPTFIGTSLPEYIKAKSTTEAKNFDWQYAFPSAKLKIDAKTGLHYQHHRHHSHLQKEVRRAVKKANINKPASCSTFRNSFCVKLVEYGYDLQIIQRLLGHRDIKTTQQFISIANNKNMNIQSPLDIV